MVLLVLLCSAIYKLTKFVMRAGPLLGTSAVGHRQKDLHDLQTGFIHRLRRLVRNTNYLQPKLSYQFPSPSPAWGNNVL